MFKDFWKDKIYNPLADAGKALMGDLQNTLKAFGSDMNAAFPNATPGSPSTPGSPGTGYYQIKPNDTGYESVSTATGIPVTDLVAANGGTRTIPEAGSYIATKPQQLTANPVSMNQGQARIISADYAPMKSNQTPTVSTQPNYNAEGRGAAPNYFNQLAQQRDQVNQSFQTFSNNYRLTGQMDMNLLPQNISMTMLQSLDKKGFFPPMDAEGNPLTPSQVMNQYGYEFKNGQYVQTGGAVNPNKPTVDYSKPREGQVMDNKFVAVKKGNKIVWINTKNQGGGPAPVTPEEAANTGSQPTTILGLNIGSG